MSTTRDLQGEVARLRALLREVVRLEDPGELPALRERIERHLDANDARRGRDGFSTPEAREAIAARRTEEVEARRAGFAPMMLKLAAEGASLDQIAKALNEAGVSAPAGGAWAKGSVKYQLDRLPRD